MSESDDVFYGRDLDSKTIGGEEYWWLKTRLPGTDPQDPCSPKRQNLFLLKDEYEAKEDSLGCEPQIMRYVAYRKKINTETTPGQGQTYKGKGPDQKGPAKPPAKKKTAKKKKTVKQKT